MKLLLHDNTQRQLERAEQSPGGFIFYGQAEIGKMSAALNIVKKLNCLSDVADQKGSDGCARCGQITAGSYPDLIIVKLEEDEASIGVAAIRELSQKLSSKPYYNDSERFLLIDQAELLTSAAQNALLKLIEEPPPRTRAILVSLSLESLLPTVRSRLSAVYFGAMSAPEIAVWLTNEHGVKSAEAADIARLAAGAPGLALRLSRDPAAVEQLKAGRGQAFGLREGSLFAGLIIARQLADDQADVFGLAAGLQEQVKSDFECGIIESEAAAEQLEAIAELRVMLQAGVGRRVALERFVLGVKHA
jgi:hypothetical protein